MKIMLVSVGDRTCEIGLRKALGARSRDITALFLTEALLLCSAGGVIGLCLGAASSFLVARLAGWPIRIEPDVLLSAFAFAAVVGGLFGYTPARTAAQKLPAAALRSR